MELLAIIVFVVLRLWCIKAVLRPSPSLSRSATEAKLFPVGSFTVRATRCVEQPPVLAAVGLL